MKTKRSYISFSLVMPLVVTAISSPAFAFQPWDNGIFPLKEQIKKIDEALSFNFEDSQAEYQTEAEHLRLRKERAALIHQREELARQLDASEKIHDAKGVTYFVPAGNGFNLSLHTDSPASQ